MREWRLLTLTLIAIFSFGCSQSGTLIVRVLDAGTGAPVPGANVRVQNLVYLDLNPFRPRAQNSVTDSEGVVSFRAHIYNGIEPYVSVNHADYRFASNVHGSFGSDRNIHFPSNEDQRQRNENMRRAWEKGEPFIEVYRVNRFVQYEISLYSNAVVSGFIEVDFKPETTHHSNVAFIQDGQYASIQSDRFVSCTLPILATLMYCIDGKDAEQIGPAISLGQAPDQRMVRPVSDTGPIPTDYPRNNRSRRGSGIRTVTYFVGTLAEYEQTLLD